MPVPTETLRSIRKLNMVFAGSALFLFAVTAWLIMDDYTRAWREYQREGLVWQAAITIDQRTQVETEAFRRELAQKEERIRLLREALPKNRIDQLEAQKAEKLAERIRFDLPLARAKSIIVPLEQQLERAILEHGEIDPETGKAPAPVKSLRDKLQEARSDYEQRQGAMDRLDASIAVIDADIAAAKEAVAEQEKELENLAREVQALEARLKQLQPTGLAAVGQKLRNAPLLDWFNPSEKIEQVVVPGVRTDLNFLTVETADACQTCHVNIDKPAFSEHELSRFLQRQIARGDRHEVDLIDEAVVGIDFWEVAVNKLAVNSKNAQVTLDFLQAQKAALARLNIRRNQSGDETMKPLHLEFVGRAINEKGKPVEEWTQQEWKQVHAALSQELEEAADRGAKGSVTRKQWYEQRQFYMEDLRSLVKKHAGQAQYDLINSLFVNRLINQFNKGLEDINRRLRAEGQQELGFTAVSTNPVLRAHPRLDLYVDPESPHPMNNPNTFIMGCSVCHEGSGQETDFMHVGHVPRLAWVDEKTGAKVPDFLLTGEKGDASQLRPKVREHNEKLQEEKGDNKKWKPTLVLPNLKDGGAGAASTASATASDHNHAGGDDHAHGPTSISQADVNLLSPGKPAPFAPPAEIHVEAVIYHDPGTGERHVAVQQAKYWKKKYNWHHVHYHDWEKPMHRLDYVQSSCAKCHTGHFDLRDEGPKVFEGRLLFAQVGCANCHLVDSIQSHKDLKKVGPSLVHVKEKLSPEMMATWIWSPKAFRPTSEMPHFFMLENNSSPIEILRTRTEVAAMTQYLLEAQPSDLTNYAELKQKGDEYAATANNKDLPRAVQVEAQNKYNDVQRQLEEIKKRGLPRYRPELAPPVAVKTHTATIEDLSKKLADPATKEEDKEKIQAELADAAAALERAKKLPQTGDVARGRALFLGSGGVMPTNIDPTKPVTIDAGVGCVACHTNLNEMSERWITADLISRRANFTSEHAKGVFDGLSYNQQHTYIKQYLPHKLDLRGPELSGIGTKLKAARSADEALTWLYDWLRNPSHYSSYTIMPSFRLTEQEAMDLSAYLLAQERPGAAGAGSAWEPVDFIGEVTRKEEGKNNLSADMLKAISIKLGVEPQAVRQIKDGIDRQIEAYKKANPDKPVPPRREPTEEELLNARLPLVGQKLIAHYNCQACHLINGYEDTASSAPQLNDWGLKDPHKLDYGYFEHAEAARREIPAEVWKTHAEGLSADAAQLTPTVMHKGKLVPHPQLTERALTWEHIGEDRREWATHKLHNTRMFDRGKWVIPEALAALDPAALPKGEEVENLRRGIEKSYDKLKMPKFFLTNDQAQAIITYITSIRKPLVDSSLQKVADALGEKATVGRQIAEKYNCIACHNIDGNDVTIQQYFGVLGDDGSFNGEFQRLMSAPPRLVGQGAKTQPDWIVHFLQHVHKLRPWLTVRMPSFHYTGDEPNGIAEFFAGATHKDDQKMEAILAPIEAQLAKNEKRREELNKEAALIDDRLKVNRAILVAANKDADEETRKAAALTEEYLKRLTPDQKMLLNKANEGKLDPKEAQRLSDFTQYAQMRLGQIKTQSADLDRWWTQPAVAKARQKLKAVGFRNQLAMPRSFDPRLSSEEERGTAWNNLLAGTRFLADVYDVAYPFPEPKLPEISQERFLRGEALFNQVLCAKCHLMGDEDKLFAIWKKDNPNAGTAPKPPTNPENDFFDDPAPKPPANDDDPFGVGEPVDPPAAAATGPASTAPNLRYAVFRLQARWIDRWLQRSQVILPGTAMPNQWAGAHAVDSFFWQFPAEAQGEFHKKYFYTGPEQRQLLIDYMFAVSLRNLTPGEWKLTGGPEPKYDELPTVAPPKPDEFDLPQIAGADDGPGATIIDVGPVVEKATSDIALHDDTAAYEGDAVHGNKTRVVGVVKFDGAKPRRRPLDMASDPVCARAHTDRPLDESLVVTDASAVRFALVHVKSSVPGQYEAPSKGVLIDQEGCIYKPHVVGIMAGQPLVVRNSDATLHNVHLIPRNNSEQNVGQAGKGIQTTFNLNNPEIGVYMKCDVHAWMNARIHVMSHPFFAISDVEGRFEIKGLPPGKHTLEFVHENPRIKPVTVEVEVKADTSTRIDGALKFE